MTTMQQAWVGYKRRTKLSRQMAIRALFVAGWMAHAAIASAQGFAPLRLSDTGETCYSWNGGNFSAGSFSKCQPVIVLAQAKPAPLPAPVVASPIMMPQSAPVTCVPPPKPVFKHKRPPPKKC